MNTVQSKERNGPGIEVPIPAPAPARPVHITRPQTFARNSQVSNTSRVSQRASKTPIPAQWITHPNPPLDWRYTTSPEARARMRQYNKEYFRTHIWEPALRRDLLNSYMLVTDGGVGWRDENAARRSSYVVKEVERSERDRKQMVQKKVRIISEKAEKMERRRSGVPATTGREYKRSGDSRVVKGSSKRVAPASKPANRQQDIARPSSRNRTRRPETNAHVRIALEKLENRSPPTVSSTRTSSVPLVHRSITAPAPKAGILKTPPASGKVHSTVGQKPAQNQKKSEAVAKDSKSKIIPDVIDIRKEPPPPEEHVILLKYSSSPMVDAENMAFAEFGAKVRRPHYILRSKMALEMAKGSVQVSPLTGRPVSSGRANISGTQDSDEAGKHGAGCFAFDSLMKVVLQKRVATRIVPPAIQNPRKLEDGTDAIDVAR